MVNGEDVFGVMCAMVAGIVNKVRGGGGGGGV